MRNRHVFKRPAAPTWPIALAITLAITLLLAGDTLAAVVQDSFRFDDPVPKVGLSAARPKTKIVVWKAWTGPEKRRIVHALEKIHQTVPGLIERAIAFGKVGLYRSSYSKGEGPLASANRLFRSITFTDRFFEEGSGELTVIHELSHLADLASVNELSAEWDRIIRPRCLRLRQKLSEGGISLSYDSDWTDIETRYARHARAQGLPTVYTCVNWSETLAVNVEALQAGYQLPNEIKSFIVRNFLGSPYRPTPAIAAFREAILERDASRQIASFTRLLSAHPELKVIYHHRGMARHRKRDLTGALADYGMAIEVFQRAQRMRLVSAIHSRRAQIFVDKGDHGAAVAAYTRALEITPGWIEYRFERGKLLLEKTNEPRRAIGDFTEILRIRPKSVPIYLARAKAGERLKDYRSMDADFAAAIKLRPDYAESYYQRAFAHKDRGLCPQAIADFTRVIALKTDHLKDGAYMERAKCKEAINDFSGAAADYTALLQAVKRWSRAPVPEINEARGLAYLKAGQRDKAMKDLGLVLRLVPEQAVTTFTKWIEWSPKDPEGYVARARAYLTRRNKDPDRAISDFTKAIAIQPKHVTAYLLRGNAYAAKKDLVRALADFDRLVAIVPKAWIAYTNRAWVYEQQGKKSAAIRDLKEALRLNPKNKELARRLGALTSNAGPR